MKPGAMSLKLKRILFHIGTLLYVGVFLFVIHAWDGIREIPLPLSPLWTGLGMIILAFLLQIPKKVYDDDHPFGP